MRRGKQCLFELEISDFFHAVVKTINGEISRTLKFIHGIDGNVPSNMYFMHDNMVIFLLSQC
jgi:hypothetical protein